MKLKQSLLVLTIICLLIGCEQNSIKTESNPLTGLWSLHIMEQQDSITGQWTEWRSGMQGYLLYSENEHMALHLTTKGYEKTDLRFPNFNDTIALDALKHLTGSYVYFANYTVNKDNSIVEHARISHSNPGMWNEVVQRRFAFISDTLTLQPVEKTLSGIRLKWIRKSK